MHQCIAAIELQGYIFSQPHGAFGVDDEGGSIFHDEGSTLFQDELGSLGHVQGRFSTGEFQYSAGLHGDF